MTLYSRAQLYADGGQTARAIQLYRQITEQFPDLTEAREALRQTGGVNCGWRRGPAPRR